MLRFHFITYVTEHLLFLLYVLLLVPLHQLLVDKITNILCISIYCEKENLVALAAILENSSS